MAILLVRHADAGDRAAWEGDDSLRPLTEEGIDQATDLAERLSPYHPRRLLSSPHVRCVETLEPLAATLGLEIEERPDLAEGQTGQAVRLFRVLLGTSGGGVVLCSHGDVVDALLSVLAEEYRLDLGPATQAEKGSTWHISMEAAHPLRATYLPPRAGARNGLDRGGRRQD
jgi:8-oxo-dGTP diphosphatase